jgi:hypothetical protein
MNTSSLLSSFLRSPFFELLTGSAHQPKPADATVPLKDRFADKPLLLVMVARERAATLRVRFNRKGEACLGESRQIVAKQPGELGRALQAEAQASGASWALIVMALGWQAEIGLRSARSPSESKPIDRFRLPADRPDLFVSQPRADLVYTVVDHPLLDRSIVFACKRKDLDPVIQEVESAGLGVAGLRLGVASQVELWLEIGRDKALTRDLLVSDGMSVLLLNTKDGDFSAPAHASGAVPESPPRQASARPNDVAQDMARFVRDNGARPLLNIGPAEIASTFPLTTSLQGIDVMRPEDARLHDSALASLAAEVCHDLRPNLLEERPLISAKWRPWMMAYTSLLIAVISLSACFAFRACEQERACEIALQQIREAQRREALALGALEENAKERTRACDLRDWVSSGYHAQRFLHHILRQVPDGVSLDRIAAQLEGTGPQLSLEFTLIGGEELQVAATRAVEKAVLAMDCQIGERHTPSPVSGAGLAYRWRLILPAEMGRGTP